MERINSEFEADTVGTLMDHLIKQPRDMPITDVFGESVLFQVTEDTGTGECCLVVS